MLLIFPCLGFRMYPGGNQWSISKDDPILFLNFCQSMIPEENDIDSGDELFGTTLTHNSVVDSILNDFNDIQGSYLILSDADRDVTYNVNLHSKRTIDICIASQQGVTAGQAKLKVDDDGKFIGCTINMEKAVLKKAKGFIRTVTHEIGHCLALDHPQETSWAIMSYFSNAHRLQSDDKAGIVTMYPENSDDVKLQNTFGLACSTK